MRIDRRPLLDTRVDAALFVDRTDEVARLTRSLRLGLNAIVFGERGSGKTSLLRHATWTVRSSQPDTSIDTPDDWRFVHVSAADAEKAGQLMQRVSKRVTGEDAATVAGSDDPLTLIERLGEALQPPAGLEDLTTRTVVVVDDLTAPVGRALFGGLRDGLWRLGITWLVGCTDTEVEALLLPPVDAFFETVVSLGGLAGDAAAEVVHRRLANAAEPVTGLSKQDLRRLVAASDGNPRRLLDLVRAVVVDDVPVGRLLGRLSMLTTRLGGVSRRAAMLAAELDSLGAASPSDPQLQQRMGVSRPRLVKLFGELREAGLVEETTAAPLGPGRPKVLYRLVAADRDVPGDVADWSRTGERGAS